MRALLPLLSLLVPFPVISRDTGGLSQPPYYSSSISNNSNYSSDSNLLRQGEGEGGRNGSEGGIRPLRMWALVENSPSEEWAFQRFHWMSGR